MHAQNNNYKLYNKFKIFHRYITIYIYVINYKVTIILVIHGIVLEIAAHNRWTWDGHREIK